MQIVPHPSPNFGERRGGATPDIIVLHYTAMPDATGALARLCDESCEVSAHYLIDETGKVFLMVPEEARAWHAGAGRWGAVSDVNSRSIGIELSNTGLAPFAAAQMDTLETLLPAIMGRWDIPAERVIGHSDMAPGRKQDPGARFDWARLARQGLAVWPEPQKPATDVTEGRFRDLATQFGYCPDMDPDVVLAAMRLRFRPRHTGPLDAIDIALIHDLATRFPVDRTVAST